MTGLGGCGGKNAECARVLRGGFEFIYIYFQCATVRASSVHRGTGGASAAELQAADWSSESFTAGSSRIFSERSVF